MTLIKLLLILIFNIHYNQMAITTEIEKGNPEVHHYIILDNQEIEIDKVEYLFWYMYIRAESKDQQTKAFIKASRKTI